MGTATKEKKLQRLTLEQLIAAKERKDQELLATKEIEIPSLGGTLLFKRPSDSTMFEFINATNKLGETDIEAIVDEMAKIIYACCDQLHDKELYEAFDVGDPVDVVFEIMDSGEIMDIGDKVCEMNSIYGNAAEKIKNL